MSVRSLKIDRKSPLRLLNREISWLEFNTRVLEEAASPQNPLYERFQFLAISDNNLDEFFMVRVASLKRKIAANLNVLSPEGITLHEQLRAILSKTTDLFEFQFEILQTLVAELKEEGVNLTDIDNLTAKEEEWLLTYFDERVFPVITPLAIDPMHPFPMIPNDSLSLVLKLYDIENKCYLWSLVPIPIKLVRFIKIAYDNKKLIPVEQVIAKYLDRLFPNFDIISHGLIHLIRDSEMDIEDDLEDVEELIESFKHAIQERKMGDVIRLVVNESMDEELVNFVNEELKVDLADIFRVPGLLNLSSISEVRRIKLPKLHFSSFSPVVPGKIRGADDIFALIKKQDILLHHPYESFDILVRIMQAAAKDPNVIAIKQTLYRTGTDSSVVQSLIDAAQAGKSVTVVVEIKARFDEERNIKVAQALEKAGAQVVFGFINYKTHAKLLTIARREGRYVRNYVHFGTGNYHTATSKIYTDIGYITADKKIANEAAKVFNFVTGYVKPTAMSKIIISPLGLREYLIKLIRQEIENANANKPARIIAKMNSLVDAQMIDTLYEASEAGVKIDLIIRGICCLRPGITGLSSNIKVKSIVGRYLEHSRIFCFANGGKVPSKNSLVFISSADWMPRSFQRRIETFVPIEKEPHKSRIISEILMANLKDNTQSWSMQTDGTYRRIKSKSKEFNIHKKLMEIASNLDN